VSAPLPAQAVELVGLTKRFAGRGLESNGRRAVRQEIMAVDGIDLEIPRGEIFGLLGPNGAGKTTTIRMICTLLVPSGGTARVWGFDVASQATEVRRSLGVLLTGERSVYWKLTGRENLEYFASLYQVRADDLVERYSTGMRQRLALIKAMVHDPPILLLDEPTTGLDPQAARNIRELIRHLHAVEGKTVILTTHYMEEADQLCDRIGIIDHGRIIALDSPQVIKRTLGQGPVLRVEIEGGTEGLEGALRAVGGVSAVSVGGPGGDGGRELVLHLTDAREALPRAVEAINRGGGHVRHLQLVETSLEDVFIHLTGRRLRD